MAETIWDAIYPLTVTADRYGGAYSGGNFLAWNLDPADIPEEPFADDVTCMTFWNEGKWVCGIGNTPEEAIANLYILLGGDTNG